MLDCWTSHVVFKPAFTGMAFSLTTAPLTENPFCSSSCCHVHTPTHIQGLFYFEERGYDDLHKKLLDSVEH
jgi:hypothetical protein